MITKIKETHNQEFYKTINDFFDTASVSDYVQNQHNLLNDFLDSDINLDNKESIQDVVHCTLTESTFLIRLKETWDRYKEINKIIIE